MSEHTPAFHKALEQVGIIAREFEKDVGYSAVTFFALEHGLTEREAQIACLVLQEACGCVLAEEQGIILPDAYHVHEGGEIETIAIKDDNVFQATYFLAYHLRHGGRNDLFVKIVRHSSILGVINNFMNADSKNSLGEMKGATLAPFQLLL